LHLEGAAFFHCQGTALELCGLDVLEQRLVACGAAIEAETIPAWTLIPRSLAIKSLSCFATVSNRENNDLFPVVMVQGDISPMAEFDHPLPEFYGELINWSANLRMFAEGFHALAERSDGALGCIQILRCQKSM
jgi:hypothetical protein